MSLDSYERLTFDHREHGVLVVTIDRADKYNAADEVLHGELAHVWADVDGDPDTRVAVVTGAGKAFSAGGDLAMIEAQLGDYARTLRVMREAAGIVHGMVACEKPIVSAVNGVAVGAGLAVALMADVSVVAEDAPISDGHARLGVAAGDHAAAVWPILCGLARSKYYLMTADFLDGREAERIGLVAKAVPAADVLPTALDIAERLATGPQDAIRFTKRALNHWVRQAIPIFEASLAYEMLGFFGPDAAEGLEALKEKRRPSFG